MSVQIRLRGEVPITRLTVVVMSAVVLVERFFFIVAHVLAQRAVDVVAALAPVKAQGVGCAEELVAWLAVGVDGGAVLGEGALAGEVA